MINVLIAEDELLIRIGLESSIPWNELGFHIVATASDGEKAWENYQRYRPEVLITDIRMPKLDGIELISRIRKEDSRCKIIIITCIEYFDVLYQSLDLGITGYLLKASMTHNNLYNLLNQVKRELASAQELSYETQRPSLSINDLFRKYLLDRTITLNELLADAPQLRIRSTEHGHLLTVCCGYANNTLFKSIINTLKEEISSLGDFLITNSEDKIYLFIQSMQPIPFDMISTVMDNLCEYIEDTFSLALRFTFAPVEKFSELPTIVDMSNHFIDQPYFFPNRGTYLSGNQPYSIPLSTIESFRNNLSCYAFFDGNISERFLGFIDALRTGYGTDKSAFLTDLSRLIDFISDFCYSPVKKEQLSKFALSSYDNAPKVLEQLWEIVPHYSPNPSYISKMLETIRYIHKNYKETISIPQLAAMLNVSPNYYAILFRKVTDFNFSDFLLGIRLYHARCMLRETTYSMSHIADRCGFSDAAYFSKAFKQTYGITPRQYRAPKAGNTKND